jgi:hypothetical protein
MKIPIQGSPAYAIRASPEEGCEDVSSYPDGDGMKDPTDP